MPPKRRNTRAKAPALTPEEQQLRDQLDLLLKDFDKQCQSLKAESARESRTAGDSVNTLFKLEIMKIPMETKALKWEDYYQQHAENALGISNAVAEAVDDSVMEAVDTQVSQLKSAMKTTTKKSRTKKSHFNDQNVPQSATRSSSRSRFPTNKLLESNLETPNAYNRSRTVMETPVNSRAPLGSLQTPMITPKFDTSSLIRTVSRVARAGEVLVSLSGSPVAPMVGAKTKVGKEIANDNALIPLGDGNTLNLPINDTGSSLALDLDMEQMAKLEELHRSLGNMLKMRDQNRT